MRLASFLARWALALLAMAVLTVLSIFVVAAYLTTWPVLRLSARDRRLRAGLDLATALAAFVTAFQGEPAQPGSGAGDGLPVAAADEPAPQR